MDSSTIERRDNSVFALESRSPSDRDRYKLFKRAAECAFPRARIFLVGVMRARKPPPTADRRERTRARASSGGARGVYGARGSGDGGEKEQTWVAITIAAHTLPRTRRCGTISICAYRRRRRCHRRCRSNRTRSRLRALTSSRTRARARANERNRSRQQGQRAMTMV